MNEDVLRYLNNRIPHGMQSVELSRDGKRWMCRICTLKGRKHSSEISCARTPLHLRIRKHFSYHNHFTIDNEWHLLPGAQVFIDDDEPPPSGQNITEGISPENRMKNRNGKRKLSEGDPDHNRNADTVESPSSLSPKRTKHSYVVEALFDDIHPHIEPSESGSAEGSTSQAAVNAFSGGSYTSGASRGPIELDSCARPAISASVKKYVAAWFSNTPLKSPTRATAPSDHSCRVTENDNTACTPTVDALRFPSSSSSSVVAPIPYEHSLSPSSRKPPSPPKLTYEPERSDIIDPNSVTAEEASKPTYSGESKVSAPSLSSTVPGFASWSEAAKVAIASPSKALQTAIAALLGGPNNNPPKPSTATMRAVVGSYKKTELFTSKTTPSVSGNSSRNPSTERISALKKKAENIVPYDVGSAVDVLDKSTNIYCPAIVLSCTPTECRVRYVGWGTQYDETFTDMSLVSKSGVHVYKRKAWVRLDAKLGWWPSYLTIRTPAVVDKDGFGRNNLRLTELMFVEPVVPVVSMTRSFQPYEKGYWTSTSNISPYVKSHYHTLKRIEAGNASRFKIEFQECMAIFASNEDISDEPFELDGSLLVNDKKQRSKVSAARGAPSLEGTRSTGGMSSSSSNDIIICTSSGSGAIGCEDSNSSPAVERSSESRRRALESIRSSRRKDERSRADVVLDIVRSGYAACQRRPDLYDWSFQTHFDPIFDQFGPTPSLDKQWVEFMYDGA